MTSEDVIGWTILIVSDLAAVGFMFAAVRTRQLRSVWIASTVLSVIVGNVLAAYWLTRSTGEILGDLAWQAFLLGLALVLLPRLGDSGKEDDADTSEARGGGGW